MTLDLSSLETVWVVLAQDGIDEHERLVCFTTNEADANRALKLCEEQRNAGKLAIDPKAQPLHPAGYSGTSYSVEMTHRWPDFGQRFDERERKP